MATHVMVIDLWRCLGSGSCYATCQSLKNNPPKIGLIKVGPYETSKGKPMIRFLHYPIGSCNECAYCMEMFQREGTTPCVINCPQKAISILKLEDLPKLLADKKSGDGLYIQIFK
jgi:Fe-S-cluster-containing dehydrogenase component